MVGIAGQKTGEKMKNLLDYKNLSTLRYSRDERH